MGSQGDEEKPLNEGNVAPSDGAEDEAEVTVVVTDAAGNVSGIPIETIDDEEGDDEAEEEEKVPRPRYQRPGPLWLHDPEAFEAQRQERVARKQEAIDCNGDIAQLEIDDLLLVPFETLEGILKERKSNVVSAFIHNAMRHGAKAHAPDLAAAATAGAAIAAAGHPALGVLLGLATAVVRRVRDTRRVRRKGRRDIATMRVVTANNEATQQLLQYIANLNQTWTVASKRSGARSDALPQIAEFQNVWMLSCWRLVHIMQGYNARAVAVNGVAKDETSDLEERIIASRMGGMLIGYRTRILRIQSLLADAQSRLSTTRVLAEHNAALMARDIFGDRRTNAPRLHWFPIPGGELPQAELPEQFEKDMDFIEGDAVERGVDLEAEFARMEREETERTAKHAVAELLAENDPPTEH
ncbi:MAG: hypothetical protein QY323_03470 [Patescibacteria group bacterium]|nr:MAG: hypothetical protein QY323_03470 [Patescibacteria group bacterium]